MTVLKEVITMTNLINKKAHHARDGLRKEKRTYNSTSLDPINDFLVKMYDSGVYYKGNIIADSQIHRFSLSDKKYDKAGWYVFTGEYGAFGVFGKIEKIGWSSANNHQLTKEERQELSRQIKASQIAREKELAIIHNQTAIKANKIWDNLKTNITSDYLSSKLVKPYGLRFGDDFTAVPVCDLNNKLWGLQYIYDSGKEPPYLEGRNKTFLKRGKKKGCCHILGNIDRASYIYLCEGYATGASIYEATNNTTVVSFDVYNLEPVIIAIKERYPKIDIIIAADNDQWKDNNIGREKAEELSKKYGCLIKLPEFPENLINDLNVDNNKLPTDWNDYHQYLGLDELKKSIIVESINKINVINFDDFLNKEIKPLEMFLSPIIPEQGITMLYAQRGVGKTHIAIGIAYAVATGSKFLNWHAPKARKVLYIDGEMSAASMQERFQRHHQNNDIKLKDGSYFQIVTPDFQDGTIPSISDKEGQNEIDKLLDGIELVIIDNISTLCRGGKENETESWIPVQEWILSLRRSGKSILFIHHAGKSNAQRGNSKKEDIMDTVISLTKPEDYNSSQGARFEVKYEKARGFYGNEAEPFEANLLENGSWITKPLKGDEIEEVMKLSKEGKTQRQIAEHIGKSPSTVNRTLKKIEEKKE